MEGAGGIESFDVVLTMSAVSSGSGNKEFLLFNFCFLIPVFQQINVSTVIVSVFIDYFYISSLIYKH